MNKVTMSGSTGRENCFQRRYNAVRKQKSQVQVPPKPPRASVKTSGFMKVRRAWIREEAGGLAKAVVQNWKVISQWSPRVAISLVFIVSCLSLHSKLVKRHLSRQQVFPSPGCGWRVHT